MAFFLPYPKIQIIEAVLQTLTQSDWFEHSETNIQSCTQLVMVLAGNKGLSIAELHAECKDTARELFGKSAVRDVIQG